LKGSIVQVEPAAESSEVIEFPAGASPAQRPDRSVGYANVRMNALKHGVLSQHMVLAHEDRSEFDALLVALVEEHQPSGATELHLVEEMAGAIWRKRRVLQAEGATINRGVLEVAQRHHGLSGAWNSPVRAAVPFEPMLKESRLNQPSELAEMMRESKNDAAQRFSEVEADLAASERAMAILRRGGTRAYDRALKALNDTSAECWANAIDSGDWQDGADGLQRYLSEDLLPFCRQALVEGRHLGAIKAQTLGEGLQAHRLEKLNRYETHLDRKFERSLAMLLKLKEIKRVA
jgi:hypothetical protein